MIYLKCLDRPDQDVKTFDIPTFKWVQESYLSIFLDLSFLEFSFLNMERRPGSTTWPFFFVRGHWQIDMFIINTINTFLRFI